MEPLEYSTTGLVSIINLPAGFDITQYMGEFFMFGAPLIGVVFLVACGLRIYHMLRSI